jgi:hypothetical protein
MEISCPPLESITSREDFTSREIFVSCILLSYVEDLLVCCTEDKMFVSPFQPFLRKFLVRNRL